MSTPTAIRPAAVHQCVTCAALPVRPLAVDDLLGRLGDSLGIEYQPPKPRPIDDKSRTGTHGGPRSLRCTTHYRAHVNAAKQRASNARSRKRSGLPDDVKADVLTEQGDGCAGCGHGPGRKRRNLAADHNHDQAAEHDHDDDVACEDCMRGYLCSSCNRDILGMLRGRMGSDLAAARVLANLATYLADPPAQRVIRRRRLTSVPA